AGFGLVVLGIGLQIERIWAFLQQRRSAVVLNVFLMTVLALAMTVLVNYIGYRNYREFDWTRQGFYSISDETLQVLSHLERPIKLYVFPFDRGDDQDVVRRLIDHYCARTSKITVERLDPGEDRARFQEMAKLLGLETWSDAQGIIVQSGSPDERGAWKSEKSKHISSRELFESGFDMESRGRGSRKFKGESVLTSAILEVSESSKAKLYFLTGHGEANIEGHSPDNPDELGELTRTLKQRNYDIAPLDLMSGGKGVPDDASVIVVAGPKRPLDDREVLALQAYLKGGGSLLAMLKPVKKPNAAATKLVWVESGLERLLRSYNVELQNLELAALRRNGTLIEVVQEILCTGWDSQSKITQPFLAMGGVRAGMIQPRPLKALTENPKAKATEILKTQPSWAVPDIREMVESEQLPPREELIPRAVMVQVEEHLDSPPAKPGEKPKERTTKIVVVGESQWVSNPLLEAPGVVNQALLQNCIAYLVGQERFSKEPVRESSYKIDMKPELVDAYSLLALPGMPIYAVLMGLVVWIVRRR
ncbi:Gldg family protein, partial [bacterium]|nr:Gldg family protein [bacterium]